MSCATRSDPRQREPLCRVPRSGPRHRGAPLPCAPIRPTAKGRGGGAARPEPGCGVLLASGQRGVRPGTASGGGVQPGPRRGTRARVAARQGGGVLAGLPCAYGPAHGKGHVCRVPRPQHTANLLTILYFNFSNGFFSNFVFKRSGILFHVLKFITFDHYIAKVIEKFMFYFDIVIVSCV